MGKKSKQKQNRQKSKPAVQMQQLPKASASILGDRILNTSKVSTESEDYGYVRQDIRKISLLFIAIIVILSAVVIVNSRSNLLLDMGSSVARFLHLQ